MPHLVFTMTNKEIGIHVLNYLARQMSKYKFAEEKNTTERTNFMVTPAIQVKTLRDNARFVGCPIICQISIIKLRYCETMPYHLQ